MRQIEPVMASKVLKTASPAKASNKITKQSNKGTKLRKVALPDRSGSEPIVLRPYQVEAVERVGAGVGCRRLIADEMRVGKTPTAIGIDFQIRADLYYRAWNKKKNNCTLIVCDKTALDVWVEHLQRMGIDNDHIIMVDLPKREALREALRSISENKRLKGREPFYVIVNWSSLPIIEKDLLRAGPWLHIIGDEIHNIKNPDAKRTIALKHQVAEQKTALSGTPADDKPEDIWSTLNWLDSRTYSSKWDFLEKYCDVQTNRKTGFRYVNGVNEEAIKGLHKEIEHFYIRRMRKDIVGELPDKNYRTVVLPMTPKQRKDYGNMEKHWMANLEGGFTNTPYRVVMLQRLQQMAVGVCEKLENGDIQLANSAQSPKIKWIMEYLDDNPGEPVLIFSQHQRTVELLHQSLESAGISSSVVTGDREASERRDSIQRFRRGDSQVFIGTIRACKQSIDLSRASTIIVVDRDWNSSTMEQLLSRADSLQKQDTVQVIYLEAEDSIDQYRAVRIDQKGEHVKIMMGDHLVPRYQELTK